MNSHIRPSGRPLSAAGRLLLMLLSLTILSGCATQEPPPPTEKEAEMMVQEALHDFNRGKYFTALPLFKKIKEQFPYSSHSLLAELKAADCNYYMENYSDAQTLYEEFETRHPTNEAIPYILFQIGMCQFKQMHTVDRDPTAARNTLQAFLRLIRTAPDSSYSVEAKAKIREANDFLAGHEYKIADFYVRTNAFAQAKSRLKYLLANYPDTPTAPKARELLSAIEAGKSPERPWYLWIIGASIFFD